MGRDDSVTGRKYEWGAARPTGRAFYGGFAVGSGFVILLSGGVNWLIHDDLVGGLWAGAALMVVSYFGLRLFYRLERRGAAKAIADMRDAARLADGEEPES